MYVKQRKLSIQSIFKLNNNCQIKINLNINKYQNKMWSLYEDDKELKPLVFSNGKTQLDVVKEVIQAVEQGNKIIFIKGMCGTGKSAIALNLARHFGRTSIVVPIKSLQEQYSKDYSGNKYVLRKEELRSENSETGKETEKMKIYSIVGRGNFKCKFLEDNPMEDMEKPDNTRNLTLTEVFSKPRFSQIPRNSDKNINCDNRFLPCTIEIKEKNMGKIREYIKQNPHVKLSDFDSVSDVKRMTIAPVCPYWSPIINDKFEMNRFKDARKVKYSGLNGKEFAVYFRNPGCKYYEQYIAYNEADVLIFNALKYKIETIMDRKPQTAIEIIDECDDFLDSFANEEQININRLLFALTNFYTKNSETKKIIDELIDCCSAIKKSDKYENSDEIHEVGSTLIESLLSTILHHQEIIDDIEEEDNNYINHLDKVAKVFSEFLEESFFSVSKKDNELIITIVTTNLEKRLKEIIEKNKVFVMMSGTLHSESVLKNIFGIDNFKVIDAETAHQGELIKSKHGYELDCSYASFKRGSTTREGYLKALSKCISLAKKPTLVHVNSFYDLPNETEKAQYNIDNLPTQEFLISEQKQDPLGERVHHFKNKKTDILFTTKCNRGIDFPGDTCNSIVITRFPYPDISDIFWKILKKNRPEHFMPFYMDKARRELLQRIYRGLRSKNDRVELLSPDRRVMDFNFG